MLKTFSGTDIGRKRKINQDYIFTSEKPVGNLSNLFIVADGMGGHVAGDLASKTTVTTMVKEAEQSFERNPQIILKKAIETANEEVFSQACADFELAGMGTTVVAATFVGKYLQVANVGDSRLYVIGEKGIQQITVDHSQVEEMVRRGLLDREAAKNHPDKNIITRAVGVRRFVNPEYFTVAMQNDEYVLMCSDGLTNMVEDDEIRVIVCGSADVAEATQKLIQLANDRGGKDNISVVLIKYCE